MRTGGPCEAYGAKRAGVRLDAWRRQAPPFGRRRVGMVSLSADAAAVPPASAARARSGDLVTIQYLRALAAIGVLIFHAADRTGGRFGIGGAGGDVFLV